MLQRIYGTAWESDAALEEHLHRLEEAEKRDHRRLAAELDLLSLPGGARRRPRRVAPEGRHRPQADGGLQPGPPRARRLRVRVHAAPGQGRPVRDVGPPRLVRRRHVPAHGDGQRRVLPEADELPDALPHLPQPPAQLPRAAAAAVRARHGVPLRAGRRRCTASCASAASRRTTPTSSARPSSCHDEIALAARLRAVACCAPSGSRTSQANLSTRDPRSRSARDEEWERATEALRAALERDGPGVRARRRATPPSTARRSTSTCATPSAARWQLSTIQFDFNLPERFEPRVRRAPTTPATARS